MLGISNDVLQHVPWAFGIQEIQDFETLLSNLTFLNSLQELRWWTFQIKAAENPWILVKEQALKGCLVGVYATSLFTL